MVVIRVDIAGHDRAEPDDAGIKQARLDLDGADYAAGAVEQVEREGAVPSDGRLAQVGPTSGAMLSIATFCSVLDLVYI